MGLGVRHPRDGEWVPTDGLTLVLRGEHVVGVSVRAVGPQERLTLTGGGVVEIKDQRRAHLGGPSTELDRGDLHTVCIKDQVMIHVYDICRTVNTRKL